MSVTVVPHTIGGEAEESPDGKRHRAVYLVHGVETAPANYLWESLRASGIPRYADPHPTEPNLFVFRRRVNVGASGDKHDLRVECTYGPASLLAQSGPQAVGTTTRQLRSELVTEEVTRDVNGDTMVTRYITRLAAGVGGSSVTISTIVHRVDVQRPTFSIIVRRIESQFPLDFALEYAGKVNSSTFRGRGKDQWLINVEADDRTDGTYEVSYTTTLLRTGWQATLRHAENGIIPINIGPGNGEETRQVYERISFAAVPL